VCVYWDSKMCVFLCVCVSANPRLHTALFSAVKVMCCIQCSLVTDFDGVLFSSLPTIKKNIFYSLTIATKYMRHNIAELSFYVFTS